MLRLATAFLALVGANAQFTTVSFHNFNDWGCQRLNNTVVRPVGRCIREEREGHYRMLDCSADGRMVKDTEYSDAACSVRVYDVDIETERCHEGRGMSIRITCNKATEQDDKLVAPFYAMSARWEATPPKAMMNITLPDACVPRATVVSRAVAGAQGQYCECVCPHLSPYRCDCSGLTSYAWELGAPGLVTQTLPGVSARLGGWAGMEAGDIILKPSEHVEVFRAWQTAGSVFEYCGCHNTADGCSCRAGSTTAYWQANGYYPAKGNNVC